MLSDDELRQEVRHRLESFCQEWGYRLSAFLGAALDDFVRMYQLHGDLYCPCQVEQTPDTICICSAARQGLVDVEGACFCGLVVLPSPSGEDRDEGRQATAGKETTMAQAAPPLVRERFSQGYTYDQYMATIRYGKEEFEAHYRAFHLRPEDVRFFQEVVHRRGPVRVLAISEDWCPDVHRGLPVMAHIAQAAGMELRIFPRDKNLDLMNLYLNQGKYMSIPVFAFFDGDFAPLGHWIERPAAAKRWMAQTRAELAHLPVEAARAERRRRRAALEADWRQDILQELRELLSTALQQAPA